MAEIYVNMKIIVVLKKMRRDKEFSLGFGEMFVSNFDRRCLFSCRHFEIILDL